MGQKIKDKAIKYLKKKIVENVTGGNVAASASNPVTSGGTGEAHQGGKKIKVKKRFAENFKKAVMSNPKFAKNLKKIKESSFKIPVEKLVDWASKNILHSKVPPYPIIQQYAEANNTTVENLRDMAQFYLSNIKMFGDKAPTYADVLRDLISNIGEITGGQDNIYHNKPGLNEGLRYNQFKNQTAKRTERETLHKAIKEVRKRVKEIKKLMEFTSLMKTEFKATEYPSVTVKSIKGLSKQLAELYKIYKAIK